MIFKKNYNEIINENSEYNFNKELLQILENSKLENSKLETNFSNYIF